MISADAQKTQFAQHYKQLEIDDRASWDSAQSSYRRLVHIWHPDKFSSRPREQIHAQQQFINLTKSYNALRDFHRKNKRLPFQSEHAARGSEPAENGDNRTNEAQSNDEVTLDANVLKRDPPPRGLSDKKRSTARKVTWFMAGGLTMLATIAFFLVLDRKANQATAEIGREVVRDAPESDFMPSAAEIRKSQTRGAFVKPTQ